MSDETKKKGRGRPAWQPLDLKEVEELAASGLTLAQVARSLGISLRTLLRKKRESSQFAQALEDGHSTFLARMSTLREMAKNGDVPAAILRPGAREGWRDSDAAGVGVNLNVGAGSEGPSAEQTQAIGQLAVEHFLGSLTQHMQQLQVSLGPAALPEHGARPAGQSEPAVRSYAEQSYLSKLSQIRLQKPPSFAPGAVVLPYGVCPKCGRRPPLGEEPTFVNGIPVCHRSCRPRG